MGVFALGALCGLAAFIKLLNYLLSTHRAPTLAAIKDVNDTYNYLVDPHTADGIKVARDAQQEAALFELGTKELRGALGAVPLVNVLEWDPYW